MFYSLPRGIIKIVEDPFQVIRPVNTSRPQSKTSVNTTIYKYESILSVRGMLVSQHRKNTIYNEQIMKYRVEKIKEIFVLFIFNNDEIVCPFASSCLLRVGS